MATITKLLPTLAAFAVMALTMALGVWQVGRAHEKDALAGRYDALAKAPPIDLGAEILDIPPSLEFHPVNAKGIWLPEQAVFLDNKVHQGHVGFQVLMPLRLEGSDMHVLVNRGWLPAAGDRSQMPQPKTPVGVVDIHGFLRSAPDRFKELSETYREGRIWENVTVERYAAWSKLKLQPMILYQTDAVEDGLVRLWIRPDAGSERNIGYALQWFGLSALTAFFWLRHFFRRKAPDVA
ncbi:MAG: SURF1 family protein [Proteobacteria bacterium]|nr:SURF1 family protein [Pseudomonadota bacterium]